MEGAKATTGVRKAKKKQVKDELDRIKQAEKKKRRLEKALATSAAIRSELEKKKQKKKEEQERLDKEGASIAEAVALRVLVGEDSDNDDDEGLTSWGNADVIGRSLVPYRVENIGWVYDGDDDAHKYWNQWGNNYPPWYFGGGESMGLSSSAAHLAVEAVSSLKIADDAHVDAYVFNHMLRG